MWKEIGRRGHYRVLENEKGDQKTEYKPIKVKRKKKTLLQRLKGEE